MHALYKFHSAGVQSLP